MRLIDIRKRHPRAWRTTKWVVSLALVAVAVRVVANTYDELVSAAEDLTHLHWQWVLPAVLAEALSYVLYAAAQQVLLISGGRRVGMLPLTGISVAGQALSNVLPGGLAVSNVVMYRQLRRRDVSDALTGWMLVVNGLLYGTALAVLALFGVQIAGGDGPIPGLRLFSLAVAGIFLAGLAVLWVARSRLGRLPIVERSTAVRDLVDRLQHVHIGRSAVGGSLVILIASWAADALTLIAAFAAVGQVPPWHGLLLAYCAGQMAASLPITPGGLGIAEGSLTVALVAFGGAKTGTLAAVLLYRLVAYWGLIPAGGVSYLLLRRDERRSEAGIPVVATIRSEPASGANGTVEDPT